ncbi:hypothetical protein HK102_010054, partial [Quaeritorhiza haematococci]
TPQKQDPVGRFLDVVRYYLSGWHIKPKGVKKPYNPVLGEYFRCRYQYPDGTEALYVCEQVSHHPPMSAYLFASPENNVVITGDFRPKSKFLGNSVASIMQGGSKIFFTNHPGEVYYVTLPNVYARGILFGTMFMELGDNVVIRCPKNDLICELEFKIKGFFTGTYNSVAGKVKVESSGEVLYTISGKWSETMYLQRANSSSKEVLFDATTAKVHPKIVAPESEQDELESRRLWSKVTKGVQSRNMDYATYEKNMIEENQRQLGKQREQQGIRWEPRWFKLEGDDWKFRTGAMPSDPKEAKEAMRQAIFGPPSNPEQAKFWLEQATSPVNGAAGGKAG